MDPTSASLLERLCRSGDPEAWDRFVRLYTPLLYHWAGRLCPDPNEATDLVQDVFLTLVEKLPGFAYDPARRFRGWLWTVTANKFRERRRAAPGMEPLADAGSAPDPVPDFVEDDYRRHVAARAARLLERDFDPRTWRAFWEHVPNGRPAGDVAAELGMTVGAVYAAKAPVLARLRDELRGLLD